MLTFAQLKDHPELLTPDARSPILHPDGTMTVLWEGNPGQEEVQCLADEWPGGRFVISHGNFSLGEHKNLPGAHALVEHLHARQAVVHFMERDGHGHNFYAWQLAMPDLLRRLFEEIAR